MGELDAVGTAGRALAVEREAVAGLEDRRLALEMPDPKLWSLKVEQDRRWPLELLFKRPDGLDQLGFLVVVAVTHVDPKRVCARDHQVADHRRVARRRPQR